MKNTQVFLPQEDDDLPQEGDELVSVLSLKLVDELDQVAMTQRMLTLPSSTSFCTKKYLSAMCFERGLQL